MVRVASPAGGERPLAEWVAGWMAAHHPSIECMVDGFAPGRANLECSAGPVGPAGSGDLVVYGHLDTSLAGDPALDRPAVPGAGVPGPLRRAGDAVTGHGVAVAKGPAAAALVGYAAAARHLAAAGHPVRARVLLAAGGTHRAPPHGLALPAGAPAAGAGAGVRRALSRGRPGAAVVAKAGPPGILWEEPGAAYVTVEVAGPPGLVMTRPPTPAGGGLPSAAGVAVAGVERWRRRFVAGPVPAGSQVGRQAGVGALSAGLPYKADLVGGLLQLHVYAVLGPGDDPAALPGAVAGAVEAALLDDGRTGLGVRGHLDDGVPAARTDPNAPVVALAREAVRDVQGADPPPVTGWTGSTDGVLWRHAGVDTVRMGPTPLATAVGVESLSVDDLLRWAATYAEVVVRHARPA